MRVGRVLGQGQGPKRHTFRRFAGEEVSWILRACHATTVLYLFSTPSPARESASNAVMWAQPMLSVAGREISKVASVATADSSPNNVGWVVSEDVDMGDSRLVRSVCLAYTRSRLVDEDGLPYLVIQA